MLTIKAGLASIFLIAQAMGASAIILPVRSDTFREILEVGLQPGFAVAGYVDRFLPHACFAITQTERWMVPLAAFAINCVAYFFLYRLVVFVIHRKRLQGA